MSARTLLVLLVLVVGLGYLWLQKERAGGGPGLEAYPLCPGLVPERVSKLRIDHLERSFQLALERDQAGRWYLTDPLAYPAQTALVRTLLASLADARGEPAPEARPAEVGLEPPKVVLEMTQAEADGERTLRVEIGSVDLVSSLVYARVPGHPNAAAGGTDVFRTTRALYNTLERNPDDYRDARATGLQPQSLVSIRRKGQVFLGEEGALVDLAFDALAGPDGWKRVSLPTVSLDPQAIGLLARGATELPIDRFVDDSPQGLKPYGLDPPAFTVELQPLEGKAVVLGFGHEQVGAERPIAELHWFCQRQGYAHVWEVRVRDVELLTRPADLFFDQLVVRVLRSDVARLELEGGGVRRVAARDGKGWSVWEVGPEGEGPHHPGNPAAIEDALARLERVQLAEYLPREPFEPADPPLGFTLVLKNDARSGGALGRPTRDPKSGAEGLQYLRAGDEVVALIDASVAELCKKSLDELRSTRVHQLQESLVRSVELEHAGKTYVFVNTGDNVWHPRGQPIQAPQGFLQSLDGLLNLGAKRWLATLPEHEVVLRVALLPTDGDAVRFSFGRTPDGTCVCVTEGGQAAEVDGEMVARLVKLF